MRLYGGPAEGSYMCKRAPLYLRGVRAADGKTDVLNELVDKPAANERVSVYRRTGEVSMVHINSARAKGFFVMADYEHLPEVDGEALRDNAAWRKWCYARPDAGDTAI